MEWHPLSIAACSILTAGHPVSGYLGGGRHLRVIDGGICHNAQAQEVSPKDKLLDEIPGLLMTDRSGLSQIRTGELLRVKQTS